jgi:hypothetical protein
MNVAEMSGHLSSVRRLIEWTEFIARKLGNECGRRNGSRANSPSDDLLLALRDELCRYQVPEEVEDKFCEAFWQVMQGLRRDGTAEEETQR